MQRNGLRLACKLANNTHAHMAVEGGNLEMVVSEVARELGYSGLKEMQLRVIVEFVRGRDVFAVLPTGYGKSLCYGCLPGVFDKLTRCDRSAIVCIVTPLIAIIEDQVRYMSCCIRLNISN